jgi:hypothetical protein
MAAFSSGILHEASSDFWKLCITLHSSRFASGSLCSFDHAFFPSAGDFRAFLALPGFGSSTLVAVKTFAADTLK